MKNSGAILMFVVTVTLFVALAAAQPICSPSNWCWENPLPQGNTLNGIWNDGEEIYTVSTGGTILHYDGNVWTMMDSPTTAEQFAIWGASDSQIYSVGAEGTILHFDGSTWNRQSSGTDEHLSGLWGVAENDVWAAGGSGVILHYDGDSWTAVASVSPTNVSFRALWGSGPHDIFAVGDEGTILHYNGVDWTEMTSGTTVSLHAVWGAGPSEVFAAGGDLPLAGEGTILFYDGSSWTVMDLETEETIHAIWGSGSDDVFATGSDWNFSFSGLFLTSTTMYHYDGVSWSEWSETPHEILCLTGDAPNRAFAAGVAGTMMDYDGESWSRLSSGPLFDFGSVWGSSATDVYVGGEGGNLLHFDGSGWYQVSWEYDQDIRGIWGTGPDDIYVGIDDYSGVQVRGIVLHYDGTSWTEIYYTPLDHRITAMWGIGTDLFMGTKDSGYGANIYSYDGSSWTVYDSVCSTHYSEGITAIYGFAPDDVYALCGCAFFPSDGSALLHFDGSNWSALEYFDRCPGGMWGTSGADLYFGASTSIGHYDGNSLTFTDLEPLWITGLWGTTSSDIYAVAKVIFIADSTEHILHYDGSSWSPVDANAYIGLRSIWGDDQGHIFAVGEYGAILHGHIAVSNLNDQPKLNHFSVRCYPNPFNPQTTVEYYLPRSGHVTVKVYNVRGELVGTLLDETAEAGPGSVGWNGIDDRGSVVSAGVYVFKLMAPGVRETQKVALLK